MPTLYEITEQFRSIFSMLEENGGELTEEIVDQMGGLEIDLEAKVDGYCKRICDLEGDTEKFKQEESRLATRRKAMEMEIESLKEWMKSCLKAIGKDKVKTEIFSVQIQRSAPAVVVEDESAIPEEYRIASVEVALIGLPEILLPYAKIRANKTEIAKHLKEGEEIPGVRLESSEYLRIR